MKLITIILLILTFHLKGMAAVINFDFKEVEVGSAVNKNGPTGTTVIYFPKGATAAVDIRGGAAAVRESSSLSDLNSWAWADAIVLSGGSTYGLEAASGVASEILKLRNNSTKFEKIPAVPAAVVYDFTNRTNALYPDKKLGIKAFKNRAVGKIETGKTGAGANVYVGKYFGKKFGQQAGQGAYFFEKDGVKILAVTIVNAFGNITDSNGKILRGSYDKKKDAHLSIEDEIFKRGLITARDVKGNTTITTIVTNVELERNELKRLAVMTHTSMARYIRPFHTPGDGDTLFFVSTKSLSKPKNFSLSTLGILSSEILGKAIISSVSTNEEATK